MNLALVMAAPLAASVALALGCSAPPSPPAQGAAVISVGQPTSGGCQGTTPFLSIPVESNQNEVQSELIGCDRSKGCNPDDHVAVDRDNGYQISCTVSATSDGFSFTASSSSPTLTFNASGSITSTGGPITVGSFNSAVGQTRNSQPGDCTLTIVPNQGGVQKGEVWGQFHCNTFNQRSNASSETCTSDGAFIFENCND